MPSTPSSPPRGSMDELATQEAMLQFEYFDNETAFALGLQLTQSARRETMPLAITVRRHGQVLFHSALPGTSPDNDAWLARKCRVVERFSQSSLRVGESFRASGGSFEADSGLDPREYAAHGGAFPVIIRRVGVVGVIAVSGLPQREDHAFVVREVQAFLADAR